MKIVVSIVSWILRVIVFLFGLLNLLFGIMQAVDPTWRLANDPAPSFYVDPPEYRMFYLLTSPIPLLIAIFWNRLGRLALQSYQLSVSKLQAKHKSSADTPVSKT